MTIRLRLALVFVLGTLVMLIGSGVVFVGRLESSLEGTLNSTLAARAKEISDALAAQVAAADSRHPPPIRLATVNGVYAQLLSSDGRVLDSSRAIDGAPLISAEQAHAALSTSVIVDSSVPLASSTEATSNEPLRILARRTRQKGIVVADAISRDVVNNATTDAREQLVVLSAIVLLLGGTGAWLLIRAALRPVERMRVEVAGLQQRNAGLALRVPGTRDEIARLAETFNGLLAHLHHAVSRERAFVADASHELRTPLTVLTGELELARRPGRSPEELADAIDVAAEETERLVRLTDDLLSIERDGEAGSPRRQRFDVAAVANAAIAATEFTRVLHRITMAELDDTPLWAYGSPDRIRRAVDNLLVNALRLSPDESSITVTAGADERSAWIRVADEGPGFPPDFLPVAFNRFTRADDARTRTGNVGGDRAGSGLGLAIVQAVMSSHSGQARARNLPGGGAEVTLTWTFAGTPANPGIGSGRGPVSRPSQPVAGTANRRPSSKPARRTFHS